MLQPLPQWRLIQGLVQRPTADSWTPLGGALGIVAEPQ
jgi:hypothetical protein